MRDLNSVRPYFVIAVAFALALWPNYPTKYYNSQNVAESEGYRLRQGLKVGSNGLSLLNTPIALETLEMTAET